MSVAFALSLWPVLALIAFKWLAPPWASLLVFLGGWVLLPVGWYPPSATANEFSYWIIGAALPSDMLISKAWVAPVSALLGAAVFDRQQFARLRPALWDATMLLWCLWPLVFWVLGDGALEPAALGSLYLFGTWGAPWLLGRLYFSSAAGRDALLVGLTWAGLACIPFAIVEGLLGQQTYAWFYTDHPFASDGIERYWRWRPLGFFENGNQYGLWVSLCAFAAIWVWRSRSTDQSKSFWTWSACAVVGIAVLSQSIGALALLLLGLLVLQVLQTMRLQKVVLVSIVSMALLGAVYLSGAVPITHLGKETAMGRKVVDAFKAAGRGSLPWRISQDQKAIELVKPVVLMGSGAWDWFRPLGTRPWGLALLLVGQYGLAGLFLAFGVVAAPVARCLWLSPKQNAWRPHGSAVVLSVCVLLALLDACLNSFVFFPLIVAAGAIAGALGRKD
jgi:hypothetical protein